MPKRSSGFSRRCVKGQSVSYRSFRPAREWRGLNYPHVYTSGKPGTMDEWIRYLLNSSHWELPPEISPVRYESSLIRTHEAEPLTPPNAWLALRWRMLFMNRQDVITRIIPSSLV